MEHITKLINDENSSTSKHIKDLYDEYSSHKSEEANYVKSLDLLDMYLQAYEYEQINKTNLDEFLALYLINYHLIVHSTHSVNCGSKNL